MIFVRIVVTGGGTGGHIYPALAIAEGLKHKIKQAELLYVGTSTGLEADIVPKTGLPFKTVTVEGFSRPISSKTIISMAKALKGGADAIGILKQFKPHVVVGTGGYVCGPVVLAAALLGIPTVIHEQNALPGITNKFLSRFASAVCVTFEDAVKHFPRVKKIHVTGLPIRPEILLTSRDQGLQALNLAKNKLTVVVVGGSRGAHTINRAMVETMKYYCNHPNVQILHVTGQTGYEETKRKAEEYGIGPDKCGNIRIVPYLYDIHHALAAADLIISRAGASFLSEILAKGIPVLLIPYPHAADNHQEHNARALEARGAAKVVLDKTLTGLNIREFMEQIIHNPSLRDQMAEAAKKMAKDKALEDIIEIITGISKTERR